MDADLKTADQQCPDSPLKNNQTAKCKCAKAFSQVAWLPASSAPTAGRRGGQPVHGAALTEGQDAAFRLCISMTTLLNKPCGEPRALDTSRLCQESGPWPGTEPGSPGTAASKHAARCD